MNYTDHSLPFGERSHKMIYSFGASHNGEHELRRFFAEKCNPLIRRGFDLDLTANSRSFPPSDAKDRFLWEQTNGRHYPDYYKRLLTTKLCCAIGGRLIPALPSSWHVWASKKSWLKQLVLASYDVQSRMFAQPPRWNQWESWRWWECLAAGCVPIMLDFDYYGAKLPVQPVNWKHYIGLRTDSLASDIERIINEPSLIAAISSSGRKWAREHYSPVATAKRFLNIVL